MIVTAYINSFQEAIVTLVVLFWVAFICCGTLVGLWLCSDNNQWGILISSLALPIIGTIVAITIMQKKYQIIDRWIKRIKQRSKKANNKNHKKIKNNQRKKHH